MKDKLKKDEEVSIKPPPTDGSICCCFDFLTRVPCDVYRITFWILLTLGGYTAIYLAMFLFDSKYNVVMACGLGGILLLGVS